MPVSPTDVGPILVIDDDEAMRRACRATLERAGYALETLDNGAAGLARFKEARHGVLIVDLKMPGVGGLELIRSVHEIDPDAVVVVITGYATVATAVEAMKAGAYDFIPKPFTAEELRVIVARAVERRRLTLEAKRLRAEKEAQARRFITFVSHQLRSPLGSIQQYLDVLLRLMPAAAPPEQRTWVERSRAKAADTLTIISDWLALAKVEGGRLAAARQCVDWKPIAQHALEAIRALAEQAGVQVRDELPRDLPAVAGDAHALEMLLANLVDNAVKYNRAGGAVAVSADCDASSVRLHVSDTGPGIAPEDQPRVFEEFFRVGGKASGVSGSGLGLPLARRIAEELGGSLTLASEAGRGSTFTVTLPRWNDRRVAEAQPAADGAAAKASP